ncbi:MAG: hypothetical protein CVU13_00600 [Bacteroidetes bacterium HGW-Bacteroidetes-8]|nr:MAG: hypothetical protein CVU13_00600 [Bacteroidetes bacterium HGW-Bacteroidetes-8]
MVNLVKYSLTVLLLVAYFVTSPGFGIHECSSEGTRDILLLTSQTSCKDIHTHCGCASQGCSNKVHDNNCCKTEIHHLDLDYNIVEITSTIPVYFCALEFATLPFSDVALTNSPSGYRYTEIRHGPDIPSSNKICSYNSQWRL